MEENSRFSLYKVHPIVTFYISANNIREKSEYSSTLKNILDKLLSYQLDKFELLLLLKKFNLESIVENDYCYQKLTLQVFVLEDLFQMDPLPYYSELLDDSRKLIKNRSSEAFKCCLTGCLFRSTIYRAYLHHLKRAGASQQ